ncbi:hypothetical protein SPRG_10895 [Saprolegnia parasitica CBS 223.65]|uniref:Uncharacterized protein n=1 Tax=Saprolegnia parasitica (strain CBS 223.65) TaxID=695850 RepID=A0A067CBC1_SAPPC|nr:hypothetical protein SPRG_10895 [Saprolegnia parasitica CBS 223.65]KDO24107.1 hypothetical protein SPRG_10895 [Saprolegnia parasitica CBS 223.65]|eukprot:XP_012205243.1 hypothetical protein SPRG_10895 [Saprolegnia parasitica CBS 223.65]
MSTRTLDALPASFADVPRAVVNAGGITGYVTKTISVHISSNPSTGTKLCAYLASLLTSLPLLLLPLFVALKSDGDVDWTWAHTLIPLWILDALLFPIYFHLTRAHDTADTVVDGDINADTTALLSTTPNTIMTKTQMLSLVFTILTQVLVTMRLDGHLAWKWSYISLPYCLVMVFDPSITSVLQVLQAIFVAQKLDMELSWSWAVILLPTWLPAVLIVFVLPSIVFVSMMSATEENAQPSFVRALVAFVGLVVSLGLVFGPQMLLVLRLAYVAFPALYIVWPWFLLYGLFVLGGLAHVIVSPAEKDVENVAVTVSYGTV